MTKFRIRRAEFIPSLDCLSRSISKIELQKIVLIAIPNFVDFHNYESNKLYRKVVMLKNVSTSLAKFQLKARPSNSPFTVVIEYKNQKRGIPPGMHVKLIIFFRCDVFDEPEETLVINVQQGRTVIIKLRGYRDPPILKVINIPYFQYPKEQLQTVQTRYVKSVNEILLQQTNSSKEFIEISSDASSIFADSDLYYRKLRGFDCGECLVGEQVTLSLMIKNIGGEGRFFIMSETDWCSMHIEDVTNKNMLILPSFAMWPAYFTLKPQEYIYLYIYFFPDTHGMHVETLYAICDNCSIITTEIIGDGIIYE